MNERITSRKRTWTCWAGDMSALTSLGRVVSDVMNQRRKELVEEMTKDLENARQSFDEETLREIQEWEKRSTVGHDEDGSFRQNPDEKLDELLGRVERRAPQPLDIVEYRVQFERLRELKQIDIADVIELTVIDRYEEVFGKVDPVLAEMDRRSTRSLRYVTDGIRPPSRLFRGLSESVTDGLYIRLGPPDSSFFHDSDQVCVVVTSPSTGWARSSFARICDEVEKGVPKWSFVRLPVFRFMLGAFYFAVPYLAVMLAIQPELDRWLMIGVITAGAALLLGMLEITGKLTDWLFPAFEVFQEGGQPSGTRRATALISLLITIPIGILVNQIS